MSVDLLTYLDNDSIMLGIKQKTKRNIVSAIIDHLIRKKKVAEADKKEILKAIIRREEMGSTAIGNHIALPHARTDSVKDVIVCLCISKQGVDFDSLDQEPVNIIALLVSNQNEAGLHLKMLAHLARILRDRYLIQRLKEAASPGEVIDLIAKQQQALG